MEGLNKVIYSLKTKGYSTYLTEKEKKQVIREIDSLSSLLKERNSFQKFIFLETLDMNTFLQKDFDQKYYEFIWKLEKENGKPRIRSVVEHQLPKPNKPTRAYYLPSNNILYLKDPFFTGDDENYFAELAHANQFASGTDIKIILKKLHNRIDDLKLAKNIFFNKKDLSPKEKTYKIQLTEYDDPSTIEYEAHKIIQKRFEIQKKDIKDMEKDLEKIKNFILLLKKTLQKREKDKIKNNSFPKNPTIDNFSY